MIKIIKPSQFKVIPWKNGQGETTELAINTTGDLDHFDWRLSIATVASDGFFSDFSGYDRNLVLIEGNGISLKHDDKQVDVLKNRLDIASFSGSCKTYGKLVNGVIKDFNIMTNNTKFLPNIHCYDESKKVVIRLTSTSECFAYSLTDDIAVETYTKENTLVPAGHLLKLSIQDMELKAEELVVEVTGNKMIVIELKRK